MKKTLQIFAFAVIALAALASCAKEQFTENSIPAGEKIQVSINGQIGEFTSADATKATAESVVRVTWGNGDKVYVYDGSASIDTLTVTPDDKNASYALLSGTITASAASPSKLTLVYVKGVESAPDIAEGKISIDLSAQNQKDVPFVLYSTIDYDAAKLEKSEECIPFSFATSVMTVNCTGLLTDAITKAEIDGVSTVCELSVTGSGVTVAGASKGTITRTETAEPSVFTQSDSRGSFILALAADPAAPAARNILVYQDSKVYGAPFTMATLAGNKSYNTVYQLGEYVALEGFVDLGVKTDEGKPLLWAKCNLGASKPEDYGDYFAWGETAPYYTTTGGWPATPAWKTGKESGYGCKSYCGENIFFEWSTAPYDASSKILLLAFDAATVANPSWRTPTADEFVALAASCVWIWTADYNGTGKAGYIVYKAKDEEDKGKANMDGAWKKWNGSSYVDDSAATESYSASDPHIFFPAAGFGRENMLRDEGKGYYWSSSLRPFYNVEEAYYGLFVNNEVRTKGEFGRYYGLSVRPVTTEDAAPKPAVPVTGVSIANSKDTVEVGATKTLVATVAPANATHKEVTWSSSDEAVATVDATTGEVTGVAAGTAVITATTASGNFTAVCLVTVTPKPLPAGALAGVFTVKAATGSKPAKKVHFSKGNLYYDGSEFNFEANQYGSTPSTDDSWSIDHISHFYWSKDPNEAIKEEYNLEQADSDEDVFFTNETETTAKAGFIVNVGGKEQGGWRTLSTEEWRYLFNTRSNASSLFKPGVTVCGKQNCVVLLPDDWKWEEAVGTDWQKNTSDIIEYSEETAIKWSTMQAAGAVCLPAAGSRGGSDVGNCGYYWSSSASDGSFVYYVGFYSNDVYHNSDFRWSGYSVRLITEAK